MRRRFANEAGGATAIEFAMVSPLFFAVVFGSIELSMAIWSWNVLESVTAATARCVAIASVQCTTAPASCSSSDAARCYAGNLAKGLGLAGLEASRIAIDKNVVRGSQTFTAITIDHQFSMLGYPIMLNSSNTFPNNF